MWEKVRRTISVPSVATPGKIFTLECDALVRPDGVSLTLTRGATYSSVYMLYQDHHVEFEVMCSRFSDPDLLTPGDTWTVSLGFAFAEWEASHKETITPEKGKMIADNIESALLAWPDWGPRVDWEKEKPNKVTLIMHDWSRWSPSWGWGQ